MSREEKIIIIFLIATLAIISVASQMKKSAEEAIDIYTPSVIEPTQNEGELREVAISAGTNLININKADSALLENLNGIGPVLASRIIQYREKNGNFKRVEDLQKVQGIGPKKLQDIKEWVTLK